MKILNLHPSAGDQTPSPAAGGEGGVLHPVGGVRLSHSAGRQQEEDHVRVLKNGLQLLVDQLLPEGHVLLRVPALPVPAHHAVLNIKAAVRTGQNQNPLHSAQLVCS